ncbi:hypothetical protein IKZ77_03410, partial [Candidatus Saccharibacteria bacterium]|nr:hypothetical protein [Candidatus Saccharibacteria bacterium]
NIRNVIVNGLISSGSGGDVSALTSIVDRHTTEISALTSIVDRHTTEISALTSEVNRIENIGPTATDGGVLTTTDHTYNLKKVVYDIGEITIAANSDVDITPSGFTSGFIMLMGSYVIGTDVFPISGGPLTVKSYSSGNITLVNNTADSVTVASGVLVVYYQETPTNNNTRKRGK